MNQVEDCDKAIYSHLQRIVSDGETPISQHLPHNTPSFFSYFESQHPEWAPGNSYVLHRDHPRLRGKEHALVERVQKSGLCYMHAPIVMQHYLVAMNRDDLVPMVNLIDYMRKWASSKILRDHIWLNQGGKGSEFLMLLLGTDYTGHNLLVYPPNRSTDEELIAAINYFGPGLLSGFSVKDDFVEEGTWQHCGKSDKVVLGLHAMLVVGYRQFIDDKGRSQTRFLIQNWWKEKPYIEVDRDYLRCVGTTINFIDTLPTEIPKLFGTNDMQQVECSVDSCEFIADC